MAAAHLARYPLFGLLSRGQLDEWLAAGQEAAYVPGETIFRENSPGAWVYLVRAGRVRLLRRSGPREITLGTLLPGDASASTPFCVLAEISRPAALGLSRCFDVLRSRECAFDRIVGTPKAVVRDTVVHDLSR